MKVKEFEEKIKNAGFWISKKYINMYSPEYIFYNIEKMEEIVYMNLNGVQFWINPNIPVEQFTIIINESEEIKQIHIDFYKNGHNAINIYDPKINEIKPYHKKVSQKVQKQNFKTQRRGLTA